MTRNRYAVYNDIAKVCFLILAISFLGIVLYSRGYDKGFSDGIAYQNSINDLGCNWTRELYEQYKLEERKVFIRASPICYGGEK